MLSEGVAREDFDGTRAKEVFVVASSNMVQTMCRYRQITSGKIKDVLFEKL
jgi:hypothetical protein